MRICVPETEVKSVGHLTSNRDRRAMVDTGRRALKNINRTQLRNGTGDLINAWRKWAGERSRRLPGCESVHGSVAEQVHSRCIVKWIINSDRRRKIHVACPDQSLSAHKGIRNFSNHSIGEFTLQADADLVHLGGAKIVRESGNIAFRKLP